MIDTLNDYNVESHDDLAPTRRSRPGREGGIVPGRLAGYTWDGACYCPDCADDVLVPFGGLPHADVPVKGTDDDDNLLIPMPHFPAWDGNIPATDPNGFGVGVLSGFSETDYPGNSCHVCHRRLQTNILRYD